MYKKAIWSIVLIAIVGLLTYGAVNRTLAKTTDSVTHSEPLSIATNQGEATEVASSQGRGQSERTGEEAEHELDGDRRQGQNTTSDSELGQSQGNGRGQNRQVEPNDAVVGEAEGQGYGRQGQNTDADSESWQSQGKGQGQNRQGEQTGDGTADAEHADMEWEAVQGKVVSLASDAMIVETESGMTVVVEGRAWSYAQQVGFVAEMGNTVTLTGFEEDDEFKVGEMTNDVSGQLVQVREYSGRPFWAGGGQGRSQ